MEAPCTNAGPGRIDLTIYLFIRGLCQDLEIRVETKGTFKEVFQ